PAPATPAGGEKYLPAWGQHAPVRRSRPCPGWDMQSHMWKQAVEWLAAAATDPQACKRAWDHGNGTALLAAGRYWDVLSVPDRLGLLALDVLWHDPLKTPGPTLVDVTARRVGFFLRSEEHTSELQSREKLVCRLLLEKKKNMSG